MTVVFRLAALFQRNWSTLLLYAYLAAATRKAILVLRARSWGSIAFSSSPIKLLGIVIQYCRVFRFWWHIPFGCDILSQRRAAESTGAVYLRSTSKTGRVVLYLVYSSKSMDQPGKVANPARGQLN